MNPKLCLSAYDFLGLNNFTLDLILCIESSYLCIEAFDLVCMNGLFVKNK